ncbi:MAG: hypothetical protein ABGX83_05430 [Nitrospira sp.]
MATRPVRTVTLADERLRLLGEAKRIVGFATILEGRASIGARATKPKQSKFIEVLIGQAIGDIEDSRREVREAMQNITDMLQAGTTEKETCM